MVRPLQRWARACRTAPERLRRSATPGGFGHGIDKPFRVRSGGDRRHQRRLVRLRHGHHLWRSAVHQAGLRPLELPAGAGRQRSAGRCRARGRRWRGLADRLGRRRIILITAGVFFIGAIGMGLAPGVWWLIVFRFVASIGIGIASLVEPLYISETAPPQIRGSVVSFNQLAITSGILIAYLVGFALSFSGGWRLMLGLGAVPALPLGLGMLFMPESPRWLVAHDKEEEARSLLERIDDSIDQDEGIRSIREAISQESGGAP